jgi:DNA repair exonuclease SbcCD nuclease subunit
MAETPLFTFVHCADLHLDSPFVGLHALAPEISGVLREATFKAFDNVVNQAIQRQAKVLIVAGDVYDGADRSLRAQLHFRDALGRAVEAGIQCFVVHGNHDPLSGWEAGLKMPAAVHRFSGGEVERVSVRDQGETMVHVYGLSYPVREVRENLAGRFRRDADGPFAIGVLHCNVGGNPQHDNYAPCTIEDLVACGMDYWALGHIHAHQVLRESRPCIVYPGNTQGRSLREAGERGCYVVQVDTAGSVRPEFVPTDVVRWYVDEADIEDLKTMDDLLQSLAAAVDQARARANGRGAIVRVRVTGRGDLHGKLRRVDPDRDLAQPLREGEGGREDFVWVESVEVATRPALDLDQRRQVQDFTGDFLRAAERLRTAGDPGAALREVLTKRPEQRLIANELARLSDADLLDLLNESEVLGVDRLMGDEA